MGFNWGLGLTLYKEEKRQTEDKEKWYFELRLSFQVLGLRF